jgi:hypothetical protein
MALDSAWRHTGKVDVDAFVDEELHDVLVPSGSREMLRGKRGSHHNLELISVYCLPMTD